MKSSIKTELCLGRDDRQADAITGLGDHLAWNCILLSLQAIF